MLLRTLNTLLPDLQETMDNSAMTMGSDALSLLSADEDGVFDGSSANPYPAQYENMADQLRSVLVSIDGETETGKGVADGMTQLSDDAALTNELIIAGMQGYAASNNPAAHFDRMRAEPTGENLISTTHLNQGIGGDIGVMNNKDYSDMTQLSFDNDEFGKRAVYHSVLAMLAARQTAAAEALFPTKVITGKDSSFELTIEQFDILHEYEHPTDGTPVEINRSRLVRGLVNPKLLDIKALDMIPYANPDGSADAKFVDPALVATKQMHFANDIHVHTRPLKIGEELNLLGLSQHPAIMKNDRLNYTDQIKYGVQLKTLYMRLTDIGTGNEHVVTIDTAHRPNSQFLKAVIGNHRQTQINVKIDNILLGANTTDASGAIIPIIDTEFGAKGYHAHLRVQVTGELNLATGETEVNAHRVRLTSVSKEDGSPMPKGTELDDLQAKFKAMKVEIFGYDLDAKLSNTNWRMAAPIIDCTPFNEMYGIYPGNPIAVITPAGMSEDSRKIQAMSQAIMVRNTNNAFTTFLNYYELLKSNKDAIDKGVKLDIMGAARHYIDPYVNDITIDLLGRVNNMESADRHESVSSIIVHHIRAEAWKMIIDSFYLSALQLMTGSRKTKPKALLITSPTLAKHLNVLKGENRASRMLGDEMEVQVEITEDQRFIDQIYMTLTRGRAGIDDLLSFGVHAYMSELTQSKELHRGNTTFIRTTMTPRSTHLPILPIIVRFKVENLNEVLRNDEGHTKAGGTNNPTP